MSSIDELKRAMSGSCIPYMAEGLSEEEIRRYIISFAEDKRIPSQTLFNVFQTTLKLFNTAGGTSQLSVWNSSSDFSTGEAAPEVIFNGLNLVCHSYWFNCHC